MFDLIVSGRAYLPEYLEQHGVKKKWKNQPFLIEEWNNLTRVRQ